MSSLLTSKPRDKVTGQIYDSREAYLKANPRAVQISKEKVYESREAYLKANPQAVQIPEEHVYKTRQASLFALAGIKPDLSKNTSTRIDAANIRTRAQLQEAISKVKRTTTTTGGGSSAKTYGQVFKEIYDKVGDAKVGSEEFFNKVQEYFNKTPSASAALGAGWDTTKEVAKWTAWGVQATAKKLADGTKWFAGLFGYGKLTKDANEKEKEAATQKANDMANWLQSLTSQDRKAVEIMLMITPGLSDKSVDEIAKAFAKETKGGALTSASVVNISQSLLSGGSGSGSPPSGPPSPPSGPPSTFTPTYQLIQSGSEKKPAYYLRDTGLYEPQDDKSYLMRAYDSSFTLDKISGKKGEASKVLNFDLPWVTTKDDSVKCTDTDKENRYKRYVAYNKDGSIVQQCFSSGQGLK